MAVKLSSYYWFRNNSLVRSLEDEHSARYFFGKEIAPEDKKNLRLIVDALDDLKSGSHFGQGKPVVSPNVALFNVVELKDVTSDPELAAEYLTGVHKIMQKYRVKADMYRELGRCFEEIGIQPPADPAEAIEWALMEMSKHRHSCDSDISMCWSNIKEQEGRNPERKRTPVLPF